VTSQPRSRVGPENPKPGSDGTTRWKSRDSGPITSRNSAIDPGQPWVRMSGNASGRSDRTCAKWIGWPSMTVRNCGYALSRASVRRQS
jgi:hypothetical protein